ncbi:unnamed protein product [Eruca vesicaria subsp. sativa]|uniref:GRF-type domain-containing protein n=1 Tax=Eruca vesicaria subsp. sativa TaxID=29727 RepID=A0ABC8KIZ7_ERUVS|nr:unnamed protein product [Eruca vesicaria subsp. sativa]
MKLAKGCTLNLETQPLTLQTIKFVLGAISSSNDNVVACDCNRPTKIVRSWTRENPGRRFLSCRGHRVGSDFESCNFFRWYDVEKPHGWQNLALLEAWDTIREQKEEIANLREHVRSVNHVSENLEISSELMVSMKQKNEECEALKIEVLILKERSSVLRNVLVASSMGFAVVF